MTFVKITSTLLIFGLCLSFANATPIGKWTKNNTREALAHLNSGDESGPRHDLARYLRYDPQLIDKARQATTPVAKKVKKPWSGGADSAVEPLVEMLKSKEPEKGELAKAVENMSEAYLRVGFGVPRRFLGLVHEGTKPLGKLLDDLARALRAARKGASVHKTHLSLEEVLGKAQESHYLFTRLHKSLFKTGTLLAESEQSFAKLSPAAGLPGHVSLCLMQVGRATRMNLHAARETLEQDREDLKRAFSALRKAIEHLDSCLERSWSKSVTQVVMADTPGALKVVYSHINDAIVRLRAIDRRGPALNKLMKVNFRSAVASIVALTANPPGGRASAKSFDKLRESCQVGYGRMRNNLQLLEEEHKRLISWARAIRGKRPQEVEIPFPPEWVLLESATINGDSTPIVWSPDDPFSKTNEKNGDIIKEEKTAELGAEETIALERDLLLLDEVERLLRPGAEIVADSTTAAFIDAKHTPKSL